MSGLSHVSVGVDDLAFSLERPTDGRCAAFVFDLERNTIEAVTGV